MKRLLLIALGLSLFLTGCIPSLHPLYSPETQIYSPELLGTWISVEDEGVWTFDPGKEGENYRLTYSSDRFLQEGTQQEFYEVYLVKLGDYHFLDFKPLEKNLSAEQLSIAWMLPTHSFARVDFEEKGIVIRMFDYEWLESLFEERKIRMKHEKVEDGTIVLTATTSELQSFIHKYAEEEQAYIDPVTLRKTEK